MDEGQVPQTEDEWWELFDTNLKGILNLFEKVGANLDGFTAAHDEHLDETLTNYLARLRRTKSPFLVGNLTRVFWATPNHPIVHTWLGYSALCILLDSASVLDSEVYTTMCTEHLKKG